MWSLDWNVLTWGSLLHLVLFGHSLAYPPTGNAHQEEDPDDAADDEEQIVLGGGGHYLLVHIMEAFHRFALKQSKYKLSTFFKKLAFEV